MESGRNCRESPHSVCLSRGVHLVGLRSRRFVVLALLLWVAACSGSGSVHVNVGDASETVNLASVLEPFSGDDVNEGLSNASPQVAIDSSPEVAVEGDTSSMTRDSAREQGEEESGRRALLKRLLWRMLLSIASYG